MRLVQKQNYDRLRKKYSTIIGWGAGVEFSKYYSHDVFAFDHMIDGANRNIGKMINGIIIQGIDAIEQYRDSASVLVVIYPNIENEILQQVLNLLPKADTIVARLVETQDRKSTYSANREDLIMFEYINLNYSRRYVFDI